MLIVAQHTRQRRS